MSTSATKQDTVAATVVIARKAITEFVLAEQLPRPIGIRRPRASGPHGIPVDVSAGDAEAWVEATHAEYLGTESLNHDGQRYARVSWAGTVPSPVGDVAVVIRIVQRLGRTELTLVPGGAA
jgi:hypothetical protein